MSNLPFGLDRPPPDDFRSTFKAANITPSKQPLPSLIKQVQNLTTSVVRHVVDGMPQAPDDERDRRLEICKGCPAYTGGDDPRCTDCGCFLKIKTSWALESCPRGNWGPTIGSGCGCSKT